MSLCALLATIVAIVTYTQPDPDGTSLAGLFFVVLLVIGLLSVGSGGLLAAHTRWGQSGTWPRRFLYTGAVAGVLASVVVILWSGASQIPETSALGRLLPPIGGAFLGITTLAAAIILLCAALGLLTQGVQTLTKYGS
jgi:hypothetical protein